VGHEVGYQVRFERALGSDTRLIFLTAGVMLRKIQEDPTLRGVGCVILDEVHERDVNTDFVMLTLKQVLLAGSTKAKVVLMSATLQAETFVKYFGDVARTLADAGLGAPGSTRDSIPIVRVEGRTFPVRDHFLEDALLWTSFEMDAATLRLVPTGRPRLSFDALQQRQRDAMGKDTESTARVALEQAVPILQQRLGKPFTVHQIHSLEPLHKRSGAGLSVSLRLIHSDSHESTILDLELEIGLGRQVTVDRLTELSRVAVPCAGDIGDVIGSAEGIGNASVPAFGKPRASSELLSRWRVVPKVHPELVLALVEFFHASSLEGSILIFLPGIQDMMAVESALESGRTYASLWVVKCHSGLPSQEQHLVFKTPPRGQRKVVLATNIAESSITIPDVVFVIDSGLMKEKTYSAAHSAGTLECTCVSQVNAIQREGRAGRVRPGVAVHLFPRAAFSRLRPVPVPEILRTPLEELCLQIHSMGIVDVAAFLERALDPPDVKTIDQALQRLDQLRCLEFDSISHHYTITPLGRRLAQLPLPPHLGRLLVFGALLGCLTPCATIAATLSLRTPFIVPFDNRTSAQPRPEGATSDHILLLNTYDSWEAAIDRLRFCNDHCLSRASIAAIHHAKEQLVTRTASMAGSGAQAAAFMDRNINRTAVVLAAVGSALYPNVAFPQPQSQAKAKGLWLTQDGYAVRMSQGSVLSQHRGKATDTSEVGLQSDQFLVYSDRVTTNQGLQLEDGTTLGPLPLLLGGRSVEALDGPTGGRCVVDGWLNLRTSDPYLLQRIHQCFIECVDAFADGAPLTSLPMGFLEALAEPLSEDQTPGRWEADTEDHGTGYYNDTEMHAVEWAPSGPNQSGTTLPCLLNERVETWNDEQPDYASRRQGGGAASGWGARTDDRSSQETRKGSGKGKGRGPCNYCGETGHIARDCPY